MRRWTLMGSAAVTLLGAAYASACALGDVFAGAEEGDVVFLWQGPADLKRDSAVFLAFTVTVDGVPVAAPNLRYAFPDTTRLRYGTTTDSMVGLQNGQGHVLVQLLSSVATTPVDSEFRFQIRP